MWVYEVNALTGIQEALSIILSVPQEGQESGYLAVSVAGLYLQVGVHNSWRCVPFSQDDYSHDKYSC